jgi:DNA-binding CsgD family transcriptional regulator
LALQRTLNDRTGVARSLYALGLLAESAHQDYERATLLQQESLALANEAEDNYGTLLSMALGMVVAIGQNDYRWAKANLREALQLSQQLKMRRMTVYQLHLAAMLASAQGQAFRTARLWGAARVMRETIGATFSPIQHHHYDPYVDATRAKLGEVTWQAAFAEGQTMTTEEAIEYALSAEEPSAPPPSSATTQPSPPSAPDQTAGLTSREVEVLGLVATGMTSAQVAHRLFLSTRTVEAHLTSIYHKLGVTSRAGATRFAIEHGLT